jgi:hypothetical protein
MLAATLFMALISHHMNHKVKAICISHNKELIRRMTEHKYYEEPYPNATLASEYDIIEETYKTCKIYNIKSSYHWVRGHQDKHTSYEDLPLPIPIPIHTDTIHTDTIHTDTIHTDTIHTDTAYRYDTYRYNTIRI